MADWAHQVALNVLMDKEDVMKCWSDSAALAYHVELGASAALLEAGYNLDCFVER